MRYILEVDIGDEKVVRDALLRSFEQAGLGDQLISVGLPRTKKTLRLGRSAIEVEVEPGPAVKLLMKVPGVREVVASHLLRRRKTAPTKRLKEGDRVKVMAGPYSGFSATVIEVHEQSGRVTVELTIFGERTQVTLNCTQVQVET